MVIVWYRNVFAFCSRLGSHYVANCIVVMCRYARHKLPLGIWIWFINCVIVTYDCNNNIRLLYARYNMSSTMCKLNDFEYIYMIEMGEM